MSPQQNCKAGRPLQNADSAQNQRGNSEGGAGRQRGTRAGKRDAEAGKICSPASAAMAIHDRLGDSILWDSTQLIAPAAKDHATARLQGNALTSRSSG